MIALQWIACGALVSAGVVTFSMADSPPRNRRVDAILYTVSVALLIIGVGIRP